MLSQVVAAHQDRGAHIVASSKDYDDLILDIIMAHTDELKAHPDKYVKFLRAIYRAVDYFNANQEAAIPIIAAQFSITPEDFKATLPNFRYTPFEEALEKIGSADKEGRVYEVFREAMDLNLEFGSSDVKLNPEDHIDRSIINQIRRTGSAEGRRGRAQAGGRWRSLRGSPELAAPASAGRRSAPLPEAAAKLPRRRGRLARALPCSGASPAPTSSSGSASAHSW